MPGTSPLCCRLAFIGQRLSPLSGTLRQIVRFLVLDKAAGDAVDHEVIRPERFYEDRVTLEEGRFGLLEPTNVLK
ncbi:MAG: hypothetical protein AAFO89_09025 [Planctomycetota bacterium]